MTASGSDPFGNSFFDLTFGSAQPTTAPAKAVGSLGTVNSYSLFNGHTDKTEPTTTPFSSTPNTKQRSYSSRPRPKGKVLDGLTVFSPPPTSNTNNSSSQRAMRDISLSPNRKQEVKSIVANTDPFTPPPLDSFQTPSSTSNGYGSGVSAPFTPSTPNSNVFSPLSVMSQDSIHLINPLYHSYSLDGSPSAPFSTPSQSVQQPRQPAMMMPAQGYALQPQYPGAIPPAAMVPQMQPAPFPAQPQVPQVPATGVDCFDGAFSLSDGPLWSVGQPAPVNTSLDEQRDHMFADLLPSGSHALPEKKKEFEPQKVVSPTLAELQQKKKNEQEAPFRDTPDQEQEEATDWPFSPLDAVPPAQPSADSFQEPQLNESPSAFRGTTNQIRAEATDWPPSPFDAISLAQPTAGNIQEPQLNESPLAFRGTVNRTQAEATDWPPSPFDAQPTGIAQGPQLNDFPSPLVPPVSRDQQGSNGQSTEQQTNIVSQVISLDDFDTAFQEAGNKVNDIKSAFEVKNTAQPQPQPKPATNDPFLANGTAVSPELRKPIRWDTF